jgi:hypothetical protein
MTITQIRPTRETETEIRCPRCSQRLWSQTSRARGWCRACFHVLTDALASISLDFSPAQLAKAALALASGRVQFHGDTPGREAWARVTSSNGRDVYVTTFTGCQCPAPVRCYHMAALRVADLAPVR